MAALQINAGRMGASKLRAARWATRLQFLLFGFVSGVWGVHIPSVKARYGLDEARLSVALLAFALGAVLCLTMAGRIVAALGARAAALVGSLLLCAGLAAVLGPSAYAALIALMLAIGAGCALFDVAINAEGSLLEADSGKKVMSGFHGMFSLGGMAGAALAAWLLRVAVPPPLQLAACAAAAALLAVAACAFMLPRHVAGGPPSPAYRLPRGVLGLLGLLAAVALLAEGAMYDWSVLYLQQETGAAPALAALGFASFSAAMAAARFGGDWLRARVGAAQLLGASGLLAAAAMATVLLARDPLVALIGFAVVGFGFANVVPILFSAAARVPGVAPADGIAAVSSLGYFGMVAGPPLVGGVAQASSLSIGLVAVVLGALLLAWGARRLPG